MVHDAPSRDTIQELPDLLISQKATVNIAACAKEKPPPCENISLNVPKPYPAKQYPHIIFGVASEYNRLKDTLPATAHWLAGTGARLIAVVVDADITNPKTNLTALEEEYAKSNVEAVFIPPSTTKYIPNHVDENKSTNRPIPVEHHHFMLIRDLLGYADQKTQWLSILDDDTFFPSLYPVDQELSKYNHTKPFWLGALSEDFGHVRIWGLMAFGGAGVFLSRALAQELEPQLETCIADAIVNTGDGFLRDCIYMKTTTKLTMVPRLFQHDILGDVSGFYESGVSPLSLHHWKSWYQEPVIAQAAIADNCGDCYLQRWRIGNNTLLVNGYSISVYTDGLDGIDFSQYEGTWSFPNHKLDGHEYDFSFGPLRPRIPPDKKKSYKLTHSSRTVSGALRQFYVFKANATNHEMDEVIELKWEAPEHAVVH
jgi:hypothetical protein